MEEQLQPILTKIQTSIEVLSSRIEIVEKVISDKVVQADQSSQNTSNSTDGQNVSSPITPGLE